MRKNDAFDPKIVNTRLTKIFIAIIAPDERLPSSATLRVAIVRRRKSVETWSNGTQRIASFQKTLNKANMCRKRKLQRCEVK